MLRSVAGVGTSASKLTLSTRRFTVTGVEDHARLLMAYDDQLRTDAETPSAVSVTRHGPLRLVTFAGGRGFITYRDLGGADAPTIQRLVQGALVHYRADPGSPGSSGRPGGTTMPQDCTGRCWRTGSFRVTRSPS